MNELIPQELTRVSTSSEADAARRLILERERAYKEHLAEVSAKLTPATFGETKPEWTRLKKDGEEVKP